MEKSGLKNIVILKNLPSNIVDEAIVILKTNKNTKKVQVLEENKKSKTSQKVLDSNKYVLKEAEMLVSSYISKIENSKNKKLKTEKLKYKYERLKKYSLTVSLLLILSLILNFI